MKKENRLKDGLCPKQRAFLQYYVDPQSETWSNALQSAKKAGYSDEYAKTITSQMPDWLSENLGDSKLVSKALRNVDTLLDSDDEKVQSDITKFTLKGLQSDKFSEKIKREDTIKVEGSLTIEKREDIDKALNNI